MIEANAKAQVAPALMSVAQFCHSYGISRSLFYLLTKRGEAPPVLKVGTRSLIRTADAEAWAAGLPRLNSGRAA